MGNLLTLEIPISLGASILLIFNAKSKFSEEVKFRKDIS